MTFILTVTVFCAVWPDSYSCGGFHGPREHSSRTDTPWSITQHHQRGECYVRSIPAAENPPLTVLSLHISSEVRQRSTWRPGLARQTWSATCSRTGPRWKPSPRFERVLPVRGGGIKGVKVTVCFHLQDDQTALHISSRLGKVDIVQQLLQCGASANAATTSGYTPLHLAAREGHQDVAVMLLENGASLSSSTKVSCAVNNSFHVVSTTLLH